MTRKILFFILLPVVCISLIRLFVIDIAVIYGKSMEPLLHEGELFLINRASYGILIPFTNRYLIRWGSPSAGDIVLYEDPLSHLKTVKRCIAVAGAPLSLHDQRLYIGSYDIALKFYQESVLKNHPEVPENTIFVLGENLDFSSDSRSVGFISITAVEGMALFNSRESPNAIRSGRRNGFPETTEPDIVKRQ